MSLETIPTPQEEKDFPKITNEEYLQRFGGDKENFKGFKLGLILGIKQTDL